MDGTLQPIREFFACTITDSVNTLLTWFHVDTLKFTTGTGAHSLIGVTGLRSGLGRVQSYREFARQCVSRPSSGH